MKAGSLKRFLVSGVSELPVRVRNVPNKGLGVFATESIPGPRCLVFDCPVLVFPSADAQDESIIHRYTFEWRDGYSALALGYASLLNHSYTPNLIYEMHYRTRTIRFLSRGVIRSGDELTINYNAEPLDTSPVGFEVV
jgi:uncharacterized protein